MLESFMLEREDALRVRHGLQRTQSIAYGTYNNRDEIYIPGMERRGREYAVSNLLFTSTTCRSRGTSNVNAGMHWVGPRARSLQRPSRRSAQQIQAKYQEIKKYGQIRWNRWARCRILGWTGSCRGRAKQLNLQDTGRHKMCWYLANMSRRASSRVSICTGERVL